MTVTPRPIPPTIGDGGVVNAASFDHQLAPGTYATSFGRNLSDSTAEAPTLPLPASLAGVQVLVNKSFVPLKYVSGGQINFQIPYDVPSGAGTVQVIRNGVFGNGGVNK